MQAQGSLDLITYLLTAHHACVAHSAALDLISLHLIYGIKILYL